MAKTKGSGFVEKVSKVFFNPPRDKYTNLTTNNLNIYGDVPIYKMEIYRTPLSNMFIKSINTISLGKFEELMKKYGFDKFFHLALVCTLTNNKKLIIQKLDVIEVSTNFKTKDNTEVLDVKEYIYRGPDEEDHLTINEMFSNARAKVPDNLWFGYDGFKNNCQYFIKYILEYSDLYGPEEQKFVFQNISELVKQMPKYVNETMNAVTDAAASFTNFIGKGINDNAYEFYQLYD